MKPWPLVRRLSMIGVAALLAVNAAAAADVQVMISSGFYGVYSELGPAFERASGHHLVTTRGPSMGDSPEAIPARLARGEAADVVILDGGAADELGRRGLLRQASFSWRWLGCSSAIPSSTSASGEPKASSRP